MAVPRPALESLEGRTLLAAAGDPDVSFSDDGRALFPLAGASVNDVAVQADGKLLLFGQVADAADHTDLLLMRLLPDGTPDPSFGPAGAGGTVRLDLGGDDTAAEVTIRPDGKIVLAASVATATSTAVAVLRLLPDGTPDPGFGAAGKALLSPRKYAWPSEVALQPDGKIVIAGGAADTDTPPWLAGGNQDALLARLLPDGAPDPSFGAGGSVTWDVGNADTLSGLALDSLGRIVTSTMGTMRIWSDLHVYRFTPAGAPDPSFGDGGSTTLEQTADGSGDVLVLPGDAVVASFHRVGGYDPTSGHSLLKLTADGRPDPTFGVDGLAVTPYHGYVTGSNVSELALQADGKIVLGATGPGEPLFDDEDGLVSYPRPLALRFDPSGRLDPTFGAGGTVVVKLDPDPATARTDEWGRSLAIGPDGAIVLGALSWARLGGLAAARLLADPPQPLPVTLLADGTLLVNGTESADAIDLAAATGDDGPVVRLAFNGNTLDVPAGDVTRVTVFGRGGGDTVRVAGRFPLPVHVDGGGGPEITPPYDTVVLTGTAGPDAVALAADGATVGDTRLTVTGVEIVQLDLLGGDDALDLPVGTAISFGTVVNAGDGNDTATLRGPSYVIFNGGAGDDRLSLLAGSATFDAGPGDDAALYLGTGAADPLDVYGGGNVGDEPAAFYGGTVYSSDEDAPNGRLEFAGLESLRVDLGAGDDQLGLDGRLRTSVDVDGGAGADTLTFSQVGAPPSPVPTALRATGVYRGPGFGTVATAGFEDVNLLGDVGATRVVVTPDPITRFGVNVSDPPAPAPPSPLDSLGLDLSGGAAGVRLTRGPDAGSGTFEFDNRRPVTFTRIGHLDTVAARGLVYNGAAVNDVVALLPGGRASVANVSHFARGITAAYFDMIGLPQGPAAALAGHVALATSADGAAWKAAPAPASFTVARGAGRGSSDRVTMSWPANAVRNTWLRVTVAADFASGLDAPDTFYFASLPGDTANDRGPSAVVDARDLARTRANFGRTTAAALAASDFNRDGRVDAADVAVVRENLRRSLPLFTTPLAVVAPASSAAAVVPGRRTAQPVRRGVLETPRSPFT